jgi:hypothetical protein
MTYSERVSVVLAIEHAECVRRITLSPVACLTLHVPTLSHKRHDFRKNVSEHKMYVLIFSITLSKNIPHSKNNSARYYDQCT